VNVFQCLKERGFIEAVTSDELEKACQNPLKVYCGFDPTADSLHLGHLVGIMGLLWFHRFGHTPFVVLGGTTGRIGDPSGKSVERPSLSDEMIKQNVASLSSFFRSLFKDKAVILNNDDWSGKFSLVDFLREVGRYFRVGQMLGKESVRARIESEEGLSFTEFSYQLLQAYDFYFLNQNHGVTVQIGGSDQWGNITAGTEFNRKLKGNQLYGLTFPLLTSSDGKKFGKTEKGAVWLSAEKFSPYQFYQYLYSVPDSDVIGLLKMLTFLPIEEIAELESKMSSEPNIAQKKLATEVTLLIHGEENLQKALLVTEKLSPGSKSRLDSDSLKEIARDMPHFEIARDRVMSLKFLDLLVEIKLFSSKGEGRRLIEQGGVYLNNQRISDGSFMVSDENLIDNVYFLVSSGKKNKLLVKII
jgi:tyrosyl-tRNA synthetase